MTAANEFGQIWLADGNWAMLSIKATEFGTMPPIQVTSHVSAADISLYLTAEEARAVEIG